MDSPATSFGDDASGYAAARLDYATAAVNAALEGSGHGARVLDLGSGTGLLTKQVLGIKPYLQVVGCDIHGGMLSEFRSQAPLSMVPAARVRAEAIPFADATFDLVIMGESYHWFTRSIVDLEIARVLRPGGRVVALWQVNDLTDPRMVKLKRLINLWNRGGAEVVTNGTPNKGQWAAPFVNFEKREFAQRISLTRNRVVNLVHSYYQYLVLSEGEKRKFDAELNHFLDSQSLDNSGRIALSFVTRLWRAERVQMQASGKRSAIRQNLSEAAHQPIRQYGGRYQGNETEIAPKDETVINSPRKTQRRGQRPRR
jgi:ubiquinone/menaquinone biosynthesis C-methylase UbiE